ncbi:MAG: hypothetical protein A3B44_01220 [Candidatus Levybacteria bacterium RIFCSPLOWO2_01_FULL_38_21]|nr:MAG: hypothetical protein A3B44_01220 [Candidatus Levybacteria bacterium RIFCSPLOWO2_01_FULL_38_21]
MLIEEGAETSIEDLKKGELDEKTIDYKPAIIEGGNGQAYFVMAGGFGRFESSFAKNFEEIRHLRIRPYLRAYLSGIKGMGAGFFPTGASPLLETYTTGSRIRGLDVFRKRQLSLKNGRIGLVEIKDDSPFREVLRFVLSLSFWQAGVRPPRWVASIKIKDVFNKSGGTDEPTPVNLNGDLKLIPSGKLQIKRDRNCFPTAALIWKGEYRP